MKLKIYDDSRNYTCQVIKLPIKQLVTGLDNLVKVNVQGNDCLIGKDSNPDSLYLFFLSESQISDAFLSNNNLYRNSELNNDKEIKGFFEDNRRVKTIKFRGIISSGFVIPIQSLISLNISIDGLKVGDEFNEIDNIEICKKHYKKIPSSNTQIKVTRIVDKIVDSRMAPEHTDTQHLIKNVNKIGLSDYIAVTYKLHGTSARYYNTLVKRKLSLLERLSKFLGVNVSTEEYKMVCGSRRVLKSVNFEELDGKSHFYSDDLWTKVGLEYFKDKLNHGEAVYCEIIGKSYNGEIIQHGYSYGLNKPKIYVYRISNISPQGIEIDLPYNQMKERCLQLGVEHCPELFYGTLNKFLASNGYNTKESSIEECLNDLFYNNLLEKPSILDSSVVEEGFCIRVDKYPKPEIYKIKSKNFLMHEGLLKDIEMLDLEETQL